MPRGDSGPYAASSCLNSASGNGVVMNCPPSPAANAWTRSVSSLSSISIGALSSSRSHQTPPPAPEIRTPAWSGSSAIAGLHLLLVQAGCRLNSGWPNCMRGSSSVKPGEFALEHEPQPLDELAVERAVFLPRRSDLGHPAHVVVVVVAHLSLPTSFDGQHGDGTARGLCRASRAACAVRHSPRRRSSSGRSNVIRPRSRLM